MAKDAELLTLVERLAGSDVELILVGDKLRLPVLEATLRRRSST